MSEEQASESPKSRRRTVLFALLFVVFLGAVAYTQLTLFVIQPIGAVPEGKTLVIRRTGRLNFVDSADSICQREQGGVSLMCRVAVLGAVASGDRIILRLPYSESLYLMSTGGATYSQ